MFNRYTSQTVDRIARDELAEFIRYYLLAPEDRNESSDLTVSNRWHADPTVLYVWSIFQQYCAAYDGPTFLQLTKEEWNHLQRLLLVLASDRHVITERRWNRYLPKCYFSQGFACLAILTWVCYQFYRGELSLLSFIPLGVTSLFISGWREWCFQTQEIHRTSLEPFSSMSEVRETYREVKTFRKQRFIQQQPPRSIVLKIYDIMRLVIVPLLWILISPLILLMQMFVVLEPDTYVILPE